MKATIEVPDELYRLVKAKSALEGRAIREVTEELYRAYVGVEEPGQEVGALRAAAAELLGGAPVPEWFGSLRPKTKTVRHDSEAVRESVARGVTEERGL